MRLTIIARLSLYPADCWPSSTLVDSSLESQWHWVASDMGSMESRRKMTRDVVRDPILRVSANGWDKESKAWAGLVLLAILNVLLSISRSPHCATAL